MIRLHICLTRGKSKIMMKELLLLSFSRLFSTLDALDQSVVNVINIHFLEEI